MTDDNQNELSPSDWNYDPPDNDGRELSKIEAGGSLFWLFSSFLVSFWLMLAHHRPGLGLLALVVGFVPMVYLDKVSKDPLRDWEPGQESNQSQSDQVCQECGWQNPHSNNYCIDCGGELND